MSWVEGDRRVARIKVRCPADVEEAILEDCKRRQVPTGGGRPDRPEGYRVMTIGEWLLEAAREKLGRA